MNPSTGKWLRTDIRNCCCPEKSYNHVHCPCNLCNGKAIPRATELRHWRTQQKILREINNNNNPEPVDVPGEIEDIALGADTDQPSDNLEDDMDIDSHVGENDSASVSSDNERENDDSFNDSENFNLKKVVIEAILEAMQLIQSTRGSIKNFEEILSYGKKLYCEGLGDNYDPDIVNAVWPNSWGEVQKLLKDYGYREPKQYFICYCRKKAQRRQGITERHVYNGKWDIMESSKDRCRHCGRKGKVQYFYLGLKEKVQKWFQNDETKKKLLAHWEEKEHWLERETTWENKNEIWDGDRFRELAWFWDPDASWLLPAVCPEPTCVGVVTAETIDSSVSIPGFLNLKRLECPLCYNIFTHEVQYVNGDPRNLAYIGHWDGWSPYKHGNHSCGAIEITVANMRKNERAKMEEIYVIGFVPFHAIPKGNPHLLDPFLQPFVEEIKDGFIQGIEVTSCDPSSCENSSSSDRIRHILLCFTGDYPAICEIGKFLNGGKNPCRRCKVKGQKLPTADHNQMYYGENRIHGRHPYEQRNLVLEIDTMTEIQGELRTSIRKQLSSEKGFTGLSILHQLYPLYGFDILKDLVYDVHHALPLNVIKNQIDRFVEEGILDPKEVEKRLVSVPWTSDLKDGRMPSGFDKRRGHWKAEEYQKFCFPISEWILEGLLPPEEYEIWSTLARLTELHYVSGRSGWTSHMITQNQKLALKFNILSEEIQGLKMCRITNHNLLHLSEDLERFAASDNYWCYGFERAVKKYVSMTSNCKHIERTYAMAEERRELIKLLKFSKSSTCTTNKNKLITKSYEEAQLQGNERGCILGSSNRVCCLSDEELQSLSQIFNMETNIISCASVISKKAFIPNKDQINGLLLRKGENFIAIYNGLHQVFSAEQFIAVQTINSCPIGAVAQLRLHPSVLNGNVKKNHYWTGFEIVSTNPVSETIMIKLSDIKRKIILGPGINEESINSIVIDYKRPVAVLQEPVVPCFPEIGDMLAIQGEELEDTWFVLVIDVNDRAKQVTINFFVESTRWPGRNLYVRESHGRSARETVHWNSVLSILRGEWISGSTWKLLD